MSHLVVHLLVSSSSRKFLSPAPGCPGSAAQCPNLAKDPLQSFQENAEDFLERELEAGCGGSSHPQTVQQSRHSLVSRHWGHLVFSSCRKSFGACSRLASVEALSSASRQELCLDWLYPAG
ncbi:rCG35384 [Rattus norvegicus]|uniref:RCG35384 n=1 Tax=Rattus norvegicus TaxID=10116 RepID=A6HKA7_RAT|nr:rCG35384 [Rattus norvegicus]